jgi:hypothetical protein
VIDGSGTGGNSWFGSGPTGVTFTFNGGVLGGLPTHAGVVWTDGTNDILFEAFDQNGVSLGTRSGSHADGGFGGTTSEDMFYGAANAGGISAIFLRSGGGGIEMDHLQFGLLAGTQAVPEPGTLALLAGPVLLAGFGLRRRYRTQ